MFRRLSGAGSERPSDDRDRSGSLTESGRPRRLETSASVDESEERGGGRRNSFDFPNQLNSDFNVAESDDKVAMTLNTKYFSPEELEVQTQGNEVLVKGRHDYEDDYGPVMTREFERRYKLPANINMNSLQSHLRRDGTLLIEARKMAAAMNPMNP